MLMLRAVRWTLRGLLAALPGPVLARLDAWSHRQALRRAQRRRSLAASR